MSEPLPEVGGAENELTTALYTTADGPTQDERDETEATLRRLADELGRPSTEPVQWGDPETINVPGADDKLMLTATLPLGDPEQ